MRARKQGAQTRVMKTVPRRDEIQQKQAGSSAHSLMLTFALILASASFTACVLALNRVLEHQSRRQAELQRVLASRVPEILFAMPVVAFAGVMLLNMLNLPNSRNQTRWRSNLCLCFVNAVALATDLLIYLQLTPVAMAGNGRLIHPLRYIQWSHSTPTMIYMMSMTSDLKRGEVWFAMANDVSMILTGLMSTMSSAVEMRLLWGGASFLNFAIVLLYLTKAVHSATREAVDQHSRTSLRAMLALTLVLWNAYPGVWLLAELSMLTPATEQLLWAILDYAAKAVFTSQLWQSNIKSIEERREAALQAWENSNRAMVVDKLRQLVSAKEHILHTMSHELRTPLLGILAMSSSLLREAKKSGASAVLEDREQVRQLAMVRSCASCLLNIVTTTLDAVSHDAPADGSINGSAAAVPGSPRASMSTSSTLPPATRRVLRLRPLVDDVASLIRPLVNDGVVLANDVPADLPLVASDAKRLSQVFFNLIGNAARFTHTGLIRVTACPSSDTAVEVTVSDSGVGLSQTTIDAIFSTSEQAEVDIAATSEGMGLGLYLVKLALGSLGSAIRVESKLGKGTSFTFRLSIAEGAEAELVDAEDRSEGSRSSCEGMPASLANGKTLDYWRSSLSAPGSPGFAAHRVQAGSSAATTTLAPLVTAGQAATQNQRQGQQGPHATGGGGRGAVGGEERRTSAPAQGSAAAAAAAAAAPANAGAAPRLPHRFGNTNWRILSVDDDQINQLVVEQVLKREKWQVVKAFDGLQALHHIEAATVLPDIILLDIMMPNMNGFELCTKLRERFPSALLPIIMISAKGGESDVIAALRCGADDYLTKPYRSAELLERVKAHMRARDSARRFDVLASLAGGSFDASGDKDSSHDPGSPRIEPAPQALDSTDASSGELDAPAMGNGTSPWAAVAEEQREAEHSMCNGNDEEGEAEGKACLAAVSGMAMEACRLEQA